MCPFANSHAGHDDAAGESETDWECLLDDCAWTGTHAGVHQHYWSKHTAFVGGDGAGPNAHVKNKKTGEEFVPGDWKLDDQYVLFLKAVFPENPHPSNAWVNSACEWLFHELQNPAPDFQLSRLVSAFSEQTVLPIEMPESRAFMFDTESLPVAVHSYKASETKRYRDHVCRLLNLQFEQIAGDGNCFFASVATVLGSKSNSFGITFSLTAAALRKRVTDWLKPCDGPTTDVRCECNLYMTQELHRSLAWKVGRKKEVRTPKTIEEYLMISAKDGVWVEGYHWPLAVATIYSMCVVVVIHRFKYVLLFGNPSHPRIHIYKKDNLTHYDALPPAAPPAASKPASADSGAWWCMVVYGGVSLC